MNKRKHYKRHNIFNRIEQVSLRKNLRSESPLPERKLWRELRGGQLSFKFRRQHGIGNYIVDFYCPEKKLVIEVDGDSHYRDGYQEKDFERDKFLISIGIKVLRFTNDEIMKNFESVLEKLLEELKK